jgi:NDP-sugar pyrophosphorylase family protein
MRIEISRERVLLDTGGGLKNAAWFFLEESEDTDEPFLLHNVDVISSIDLGRMMGYHAEKNALATLAVQERESSRYLLFDEQGQLRGRSASRDANRQGSQAQPAQGLIHEKALAFSGIHVVSPRVFARMEEEGSFSIIDAYLRLAAKGERITAYRDDESYWRDLGRAESVLQAARDMESGKHF